MIGKNQKGGIPPAAMGVGMTPKFGQTLVGKEQPMPGAVSGNSVPDVPRKIGINWKSKGCKPPTS